ncbi:hypothetical protein PGB90_005352 [Kerria lacca]
MANLSFFRTSQYKTTLIVIPFGINSTNKTPLASQKTVAIILPADLSVLNFLGGN